MFVEDLHGLGAAGVHEGPPEDVGERRWLRGAHGGGGRDGGRWQRSLRRGGGGRELLQDSPLTALEESGARHSKVYEKLYFDIWEGNKNLHNPVLAGVN